MIIRKLIPVKILKSNRFQLMPVSSRVLFIEMLVHSDYDGFINNSASIIDDCGASIDDLNLLISKGFGRFVKDKNSFYVVSEEVYFHE